MGPMQASAATLQVPSEYGTVEAAVTAAADGDTIVVASNYDGSGQAVVVVSEKSLRIEGAGPSLTLLPAIRVERNGILTVADAEISCASEAALTLFQSCLLYTSPSPRDS